MYIPPSPESGGDDGLPGRGLSGGSSLLVLCWSLPLRLSGRIGTRNLAETGTNLLSVRLIISDILCGKEEGGRVRRVGRRGRRRGREGGGRQGGWVVLPCRVCDDVSQFPQIRELNIPCNPSYSFVLFLSKPTLVRDWNIQGLPSDAFSTENGVIVTKSSRLVASFSGSPPNVHTHMINE